MAGGASSLLVRVSAAGGPSHPLCVPGPSCVIGRSRAAQVRLLSPEVSGAHARLVHRADGIWVEDLGSENGTTLRGRRLEPGAPQPLPLGASLKIGPYRIEAILSESGTGATEESSEEGTATLASRLLEDLVAAGGCLPAALQVTSPDGVEQRCVLTPGCTLRIGRDPTCDLGADDPDLSRVHAEIRMEPAGAVVVDLGSKNGTYLRGARVMGPKTLRAGDKLRLGGTRLVYEDPAEVCLKEMDQAFRESRVIPAEPSETEEGAAPAPVWPDLERPEWETALPGRPRRRVALGIPILVVVALAVATGALWALWRLLL